MGLGLGLGLAVLGVGGPAVTFDPTTLPLTGYWRANYGGSPWAGTASAGTSGSNSATEATNPPTTGTAQNGFTPALFATNKLLTPAGTVSTYLGATSTAFSGWALVNPTSITDAGTLTAPWVADTIMCTPGAAWMALALNANGGNKVQLFILDAGATNRIVTRALAAGTGVYSLITWRLTGGNLQIGVNEVPGAAGGASVVAITTSVNAGANAIAVQMGKNENASSYLKGALLEHAWSNTAISDTNFTNLKNNYINPRYGLSL